MTKGELLFDPTLLDDPNYIEKYLKNDANCSKKIVRAYYKNGELIRNEFNYMVPVLAEDEEILWSHVITKGILHKKLEEIWVLTNFRALAHNFEAHGTNCLTLPSADNIIVTNQHRNSKSIRTGTFSGTASKHVFAGTTSGSSFGSSETVGDVIFETEGRPFLYFFQVSDPHGVVLLAKTSRDSEMKAFADYEEKLKLGITSTKVSEDSVKKIVCPKCKNDISADSDFCNHCGTKIQDICSKCGHDNPKESAFCNKCGFTLK